LEAEAKLQKAMAEPDTEMSEQVQFTCERDEGWATGPQTASCDDDIQVLTEVIRRQRDEAIQDQAMPHMRDEAIQDQAVEEKQQQAARRPAKREERQSVFVRPEWAVNKRRLAARFQACKTLEEAAQLGKESPMAVVMTSDKGSIIASNAAWSQITGYECADIVGCPCSLLQGPGTDEKKLKLLHRAAYKGRDHETYLVNYRKSKERFNNHLLVVPLPLLNTLAHHTEVGEAESNAARGEQPSAVWLGVLTEMDAAGNPVVARCQGKALPHVVGGSHAVSRWGKVKSEVKKQSEDTKSSDPASMVLSGKTQSQQMQSRVNMLKVLYPFCREPASVIQDLAQALKPLDARRQSVIMRQGSPVATVFFMPPPKGQCAVRVLREVRLAQSEPRLMEIGKIEAPGFVSVPYGGPQIANSTYLTAVSGTMFTISWAKLYAIVSLNAVRRINDLVMVQERCSFQDDGEIVEKYVANRAWDTYRRSIANEIYSAHFEKKKPPQKLSKKKVRQRCSQALGANTDRSHTRTQIQHVALRKNGAQTERSRTKHAGADGEEQNRRKHKLPSKGHCSEFTNTLTEFSSTQKSISFKLPDIVGAEKA